MIDSIKQFVNDLPFWINLITLVVSIASGLAALTPTPKDDGFWMVVKKILAVFSLNILGSKSLSEIEPKKDYIQ